MAKQPNQYTKQTQTKSTSATDKPSFGESLDSWSAEELHKRASELDIPGRSEMKKDELIKAIRKRQK